MIYKGEFMDNKFSKSFTNFMNKTIMCLVFFLLIMNLVAIILTIIGFNKSTILFLIIAIISILAGYILLKSNLSESKTLFFILIIGLILRILWLLDIPSVPTSDFKVMYDSSINFLNGDRSMFRGTSYISRFPHLTAMVLYMALVNFLFPIKNLLVMKIINLFLALITIILIYLLTDLIFKNKLYAQISAFISAIFPPLITYTAVFCSENIAIPFYLLSIYCFIYYLKNNKNNKNRFILFICGLILSVGNFFRTIATVVLIAYILYIIIYSLNPIYKIVKDISILIISYLLITIIISTTLQNLNILERPLWNAREPSITSALRGSNYDSFGKWNEEDATFVQYHLDNYDELEQKSKEIIFNRLISHSILKTSIFILGKFTLQWIVGDFEGSIWAQLDVPEEQIEFPIKKEGSLAFQLIYTIMLILVFLGLRNRKVTNNIKEVNLLYLIIGGYGMTYMLTEEQGRYSYICCYIIIFLSIAGVDSIMQKFNYNSSKLVGKDAAQFVTKTITKYDVK